MCFSATASFVSAGVIGAVGAASLARTPDRRDLPIAALPLLFALHQCVEGVVWVAVNHHELALRYAAAHAYLIFAWGLVPALVPTAVALVEPRRWRRVVLWCAAALGVLVGVSLLAVAFTKPIDVHVHQHALVYEYHGPARTPVTVAYIAASNASLFVSSHRMLKLFGGVLLVGMIASAFFRRHEFVSVWCAIAAVASAIIYVHVQRRAAGRGAGRGSPRERVRPARIAGARFSSGENPR